MRERKGKIEGRVIYHCDCNAFYASCEELLHPELKQVPMAVCGNPENRHGIILAKNELAKGFGVKTAETIWQARQKCPDLVTAPARHDLYRKQCEIVNGIYEQYTDRVERFGIDESFLDVTGSLHLFGGDPLELAHQIRLRVQRETGLTISVGVSFNKIFAKLGSDYKKPNAVTYISRDNYREIVWPLPVSDLFLVGERTRQSLEKLYIHTIGDLAGADPKTLTVRLGKVGGELHRYACGLDDSPVLGVGEGEELQSVGNGMTFRRNLVSRDDIRTGVTFLADSVAARMRRADVKAMTIQVTIKDTNMKVITRQKPLEVPTDLALELGTASLELIEASWSVGVPIRMLTLTALRLIPAGAATEQLSLFGGSSAERDRRKRLERTVDTLRGRFGSDAIASGSVVKNDLGIGERHEKKEDEPQ